MNKLEVGIGPMSLEVIDAVVKYANERDREIMLIASRNQIECAELGGGYVGNLNSRTFVDYVRARDTFNKIKICRDHCGPFLHADEKGMSHEEAMERTMQSLCTDMYSGFNLIHVDTSGSANPYQTAEQMFSSLMCCSAPLEFEFGTEENIGTAVSAEKFEMDVQFITTLYPTILKPKYVVGQTGSLVKSNIQAGKFDPEVVKKLVSIADKYGVKLKEHNADYITRKEVQLRRDLGVGAINVAPEFGVIQTQALIALATRWRLTEELEAFKKIVLAGGKWKKWQHGPTFEDNHKLLCAGHYHFMSPEYFDLVEKINKKENFGREVERRVFKLIDNYTS